MAAGGKKGAVAPLDVAERRREKQRSRDADARALASGKKSPAQLAAENGHFGRLKVRFVLERRRLA